MPSLGLIQACKMLEFYVSVPEKKIICTGFSFAKDLKKTRNLWNNILFADETMVEMFGRVGKYQTQFISTNTSYIKDNGGALIISGTQQTVI